MRNKVIISLLAINLIGILAITIYLYQSQKPPKSAYIVNQAAFEQFLGKKEMEERLMQLTALERQEIDSLEKVLTFNNTNEQLRKQYLEKLNQMAIKEEELAARYSSTIWLQINQYIEDYGKEQHYDYIYGATGNGSLMYAREAKNVTEEVVEYINARYEGK